MVHEKTKRLAKKLDSTIYKYDQENDRYIFMHYDQPYALPTSIVKMLNAYLDFSDILDEQNKRLMSMLEVDIMSVQEIGLSDFESPVDLSNLSYKG